MHRVVGGLSLDLILEHILQAIHHLLEDQLVYHKACLEPRLVSFDQVQQVALHLLLIHRTGVVATSGPARQSTGEMHSDAAE